MGMNLRREVLYRGGRCPECKSGSGSHVPGCSYAANREDRAEYIRQNPLQVVEPLEAKIRRMAKEIRQLSSKLRYWKRKAEARA